MRRCARAPASWIAWAPAHERAGGVDHVVRDHADLARDVADDVGHLGLAVRRALLREHRQLAAEHLGELLRELDAPGVGRDDDDVLARQAEVEEVLLEHRQRGHVVDRDAEEALHLTGVQIHREHAVDARGLEHVRHQARRDRLARRRLLVLTRVREPRHDGGDALGRGQARRVDHDQQLHQVVVAGPRAGLDRGRRRSRARTR